MRRKRKTEQNVYPGETGYAFYMDDLCIDGKPESDKERIEWGIKENGNGPKKRIYEKNNKSDATMIKTAN